MWPARSRCGWAASTDRPSAKSCRNFPPREKPRCSKMSKPASRRESSRSPTVATANWPAGFTKRRRARVGRSRSCTLRRAVWTKSFAASPFRIRSKRIGNEPEFEQHQSRGETGVDRLFLFDGRLRFSGDFPPVGRLLHFHGWASALFRAGPGVAGELLHLATLVVSFSGAGGGDATVVRGTAAGHHRTAADHADHRLAGDCRQVPGVLA